MIEITSLNLDSPHLVQLYKCFTDEWGEVDPFVKIKDGFILPLPIAALDDQELIGGLSFSTYIKPNNSSIGLWVNAVFVLPQKRGLGIASKLIHAAEKQASKLNVSELYVRSEVPVLYQKIDWQLLYETNDGAILKKELTHS